MKELRNPGVFNSASTSHGKAINSVRSEPRSQGSFFSGCNRCLKIAAQSTSGVTVNTTANGPFDNKPIARPTKNHQRQYSERPESTNHTLTSERVVPKTRKVSVITAPALI